MQAMQAGLHLQGLFIPTVGFQFRQVLCSIFQLLLEKFNVGIKTFHVFHLTLQPARLGLYAQPLKLV